MDSARQIWSIQINSDNLSFVFFVISHGSLTVDFVFEMFIYYQESNGFIHYVTNIHPTLVKTCVDFPQEYKRKFHLFKGYDASDEGLIKYAQNFKIWCDELRSDKTNKIKYDFY